MDLISCQATEVEGPEQLELFPEPVVLTAIKPDRARPSLLTGTCEGIHPFSYDFGKAEKYATYYGRSLGKSSWTDQMQEYLLDTCGPRRSAILSWNVYDFETDPIVTTKPKKNIQPGPKPSFNARKRW